MNCEINKTFSCYWVQWLMWDKLILKLECTNIWRWRQLIMSMFTILKRAVVSFENTIHKIRFFFYFQKCLILEIWKHLEINYFLIDMLEYFLWHLVFGNNTSESYMIKWCRLRENINLKTTAAILQWKSFCSPGFTEIYK